MGQAKRRKQQLGALYGTPEGSNRQPANPSTPAALDVLSAALTREDLTEVVELLNNGPEEWERRYSPRPDLASPTAAVIVRCIGDVAMVELVPATAATQ